MLNFRFTLDRVKSLFYCPLLLFLFSPFYAYTQENWLDTISDISESIVSIQFDIPIAFDTEQKTSSQATGFVVDAELGIILTNRHVVSAGPVLAKAIFINKEEVTLSPIYIDPVHDFGFYRYSPDDLILAKPQSLMLSPEKLALGLDIRVIGNDAGEQLSILSGTIARLDRMAPNYGRGNYNDFNTFYIQAATSASGGSSGSPVIEISGDVVALNAGASSQAASSFFLPLNGAKEALDLIQRDGEVLRGSILAEFKLLSFPELRRMGLSTDIEEQYRRSRSQLQGLLVVDSVLPEHSALLSSGDILLTIDEYLVTSFRDIESVLNPKINQSVTVQFIRQGELMNAELPVVDLLAIHPDEYLVYGGGVFHNVSYHMARFYSTGLRGVYVADPGYIFDTAGVPRQSVIYEINGKSTNDLDDFRLVMSTVPQGARVNIKYFYFNQPEISVQRLITHGIRWFTPEFCQQTSGLNWECQNEIYSELLYEPSTFEVQFPEQTLDILSDIQQSLVMVNFDMPYSVSGISERHYYGSGVILDNNTEKVIVAVDRNTVPTSLGDLKVTIAGTLEIPANVEYIHPIHNLSLISFDKSLIGKTKISPIRINLEPLQRGEEVTVIGLSYDHSVEFQNSSVASISPMNFGSGSTLRFREMNLEVIELDNGPNDFDGIIVDRNGQMRAFWGSFPLGAGNNYRQVNRGISVDFITEALELYKNNNYLYSLDIELEKIPLAVARSYGLSATRVSQFQSLFSSERTALIVNNKIINSMYDQVEVDSLMIGDILLSVNDEMVHSYRQIEMLSQREINRLVVLRNGEEHQLSVIAKPYDGIEMREVVIWSGAIIQEVTRDFRFNGDINNSGVLVSYANYGSPAARSSLYPGTRITQVEDSPVRSVTDFISAIERYTDQPTILLSVTYADGNRALIPIEQQNMYWPLRHFVFNDEQMIWERTSQ